MNAEDFLVQFTPSKNCFLQFSNKWFQKVKNSRCSCLKLLHPTTKQELYFSCLPQPSFSLNDCSVGINATFAQGLNLHENELVCVTSVDEITSLRQVFLSPFSADDYEILESSRDIVEVSLLDQIRVIFVNQVISVWVSKSMHLKLIVDQLEPVSTFGRLEQMTELYIDTMTKTEKIKTNKKSEPTANIVASKSLISNHHIVEQQKEYSFWDLLSNYITNSIRKPSKSASRTEQISGNMDLMQLVCRVHPFPPIVNPDCCEGVHNDTIHPFNVFVPKPVLSKAFDSSETDLNSEHQNCPVICKLQAIPKKKVKSTNEKVTTENSKNERVNENISSELICVRLHAIEESCTLFTGKTSISCIFVSKFLRKILNLHVGSKVNLSLYVPPIDKTLVEIKITPATKMNESEAKILHKQFVERFTCREGVLINNDYPLPIPTSTGSLSSVSVSLFPEDIDCWPLTKAQLEVTPVIVSIEEDKSLLSLKDFERDENISLDKTSVFKNLVDEGIYSLEYALCLNVPKNQSHIVDNILITGKQGSGKKRLAEAIVSSVSCAPHHVHVSVIDCKPLKGKKPESISKILTDHLEECVYYQPAVLVLHDLQCGAGSPVASAEPSQETAYFLRLATVLKECLWNVRVCQCVSVIATAEHRSQIHPQLISARGRHSFSTFLNIPSLQKIERQHIASELLSARVPQPQLALLERIAERTEGCVVQDLCRLTERVLFKACQRSSQDLEVMPEDVEEALEGFVPADLMNVSVAHNTNITFAGVGGLEQAKEQLTEVLIWPTKFPEVFSQCPLRLERGVLLYGAPGTGKTLLAKAVVGESRLNSITVKGPELLSKYIGASEEAVRNVFQKAQSAQPCILFFDEFDSLAPRRGHDSTGVTDRVVNQLLTQLDGVEALEGVWVVAAASRPDLLDPALLRPGRIGTLVHCTLPNQVERLAILEKLSGHLQFGAGVDLAEVAARTDGFTGADLQAVLFTAQLAAYDALHRDCEDEFEAASPAEDVVVSQEDLISAVKETSPSLKPEDKLRFQMIYERFQRARGGSAAGPEPSDKSLRVTLA